MVIKEFFKAKCSLHDYGYYSFFFGEPFCEDGVLFFFDGSELRIIGYDQSLMPITKDAIKKVIRYALEKFNIRYITIEISRSDTVKKIPGFYLENTVKPHKADCELFVNLSSYSPNGKQRNDVGRAIRKALSCRKLIGSNLPTSLVHWELVRKHINSFEPNTYYRAEFIMGYQYLMLDTDTVLFEVYKNSKLMGFSLARKMDQLAISHMVVISECHSGVSDLLYSEMIKHFQSNNTCKLLSLGTCPSVGLYNYKMKWSNMDPLPATTLYTWHHKKKGRIANYLWKTRLIHSIYRKEYR